MTTLHDRKAHTDPHVCPTQPLGHLLSVKYDDLEARAQKGPTRARKLRKIAPVPMVQMFEPSNLGRVLMSIAAAGEVSDN